jgi:lysyl-tRNA synthetase class 2
MLDAVNEVIGIDIGNVTNQSLPEVFRLHHPAGTAGVPEPLTWGAAVVELFESLVEPRLWDPVFITDYPAEVSPLTKKHRDNPRLVERFEPMIAGMEVGNAYSELNDPVEQYDRLVSQRVSRDQLYDLDEDFVQAIAQGMPPAGGTGLGVDRVVMILTGAESIRDVVFFPFVARQDAGQKLHHSIELTQTQTEEGKDEFIP